MGGLGERKDRHFRERARKNHVAELMPSMRLHLINLRFVRLVAIQVRKLI